MLDYQFTITIDDVDSRAPQVRVWIDDQLTSDLFSERELSLTRDSETTWSAHFSADDSVFMYRVGICAAPGTRWALSFRSSEHEQAGEELLYDSDELTMAKEWLIGTCEVGLLAHSHVALRGVAASGAI